VTVSSLSERDLIARIRARLPAAPRWLLVGVGDDAAVVEAERNRVEVLTVDAIVEGVHFDRAFVPPEAIGRRAVAVNLSDLAAMGAAPRLALLSLVLPPQLRLDDFDAIVEGAATVAAEHRLHIVGGNLTRSPGPLMIDVTVVGTVKRRQALTRSGARAGDELYVSGSIGGAAAGLCVLKQSPPPSTTSAVVDRYLRPTPRVRLGMLLSRNRAANACMDLSDGLGDAVHQICEASGVGATIDAAALPIDAETRRVFEALGADPIDAAVAGGDDYELIVAASPKRRRRLAAAERHGGAPLTKIGVCTADRAVLVKTPDGGAAPLPRAGFSHFGPS